MAKRTRWNLLLLGSAFAACASALAAGSNYDQAMKSFSAGQYDKSLAGFSALSAGDSNAAYMTGLSLQRLGKSDQATKQYKLVVQRFTDSAGAVRSLSALDTLDPAYAKAWRRAHPPAPPALEQGFGIHIKGEGIAPDMSYAGSRPLTLKEVRNVQNSMRTNTILHCNITGLWFEALVDHKSPTSYIGMNQIDANGGRYYGGQNSIWKRDDNVSGVLVPDIRFRLRDNLNQVVLGQDFIKAYEEKAARSNQVTTNFLAAAAKAKEDQLHDRLMKGGKSPEQIERDKKLSSSQSGESADRVFDVPYRDEIVGGYPQRIVNVYVDNTNVTMIFAASGTTTFTLDQIRNIESSYAPAADQMTQEVIIPNSTIRSSAGIILRNLRFGKIVKTDWPARVEAFSGFRYQAPTSSGGYPTMGQDVIAGWEYQADPKRMVLTFTKR